MALKIMKYQGMASDYSTSALENYYVVESPGWKATRASGVLAVLLAAHPEMPYEAIAAFAHANGLTDWEFSVDQDDGTLLARDGVIYFLEDYPLPSNWSALFKEWQANYVISELPREYVQPAAPAAPIAPPPPPPEPQYSDFDEDAFYEQQYYNQPASPAPSPAAQQPQVVPASYNQPTPSSTSQTSAPQPPAQNAAYVVAPTTQKQGDIPWVWIIGGAAALLFLMKGKKKKR